jgi:hypothetical protein
VNKRAWDDCGMIRTGEKIQSAVIQSSSVTLHPQHVPHRLGWKRTHDFAVRRRCYILMLEQK